jgi:hypothetical protein
VMGVIRGVETSEGIQVCSWVMSVVQGFETSEGIQVRVLSKESRSVAGGVVCGLGDGCCPRV